jgi:hypothetical protein
MFRAVCVSPGLRPFAHFSGAILLARSFVVRFAFSYPLSVIRFVRYSLVVVRQAAAGGTPRTVPSHAPRHVSSDDDCPASPTGCPTHTILRRALFLNVSVEGSRGGKASRPYRSKMICVDPRRSSFQIRASSVGPTETANERGSDERSGGSTQTTQRRAEKW